MSEISRPRAVITNDDGIDSEGLRVLAVAAAEAGLEVTVAAPDGEASGTGTSLAARVDDGKVVLKRTRLEGLEGRPVYAVAGMPSFITLTALRGTYGPPPDLVLSGINLGPNTGRQVLHSGTVGAALTAAVRGTSAGAFSLWVREGAPVRHWATAAVVAAQIIPVLRDLPAGTLLNVNVPNVPAAELRGIRTGPLTDFSAYQTMAETAEDHLIITGVRSPGKPEPGSDSALVMDGYAAVTPLRPVSEADVAGLPWPAED